MHLNGCLADSVSTPTWIYGIPSSSTGSLIVLNRVVASRSSNSGDPDPRYFLSRVRLRPLIVACVWGGEGEGALSRFTLLLFFPILPSNICSPTRKGVQLVLSIEFAIDALFFFDEDRDRFGWFTVGMDRRSFGDWTILKFHVS